MPRWMGAPYNMNLSSSPRALYCQGLLLVVWMALCHGAVNETELPSLLNKVYNVIEDKSVNPFCFTVTLYDLTCFWESDTSNASRYEFTYSKHEMRTCNVTAVSAANGTWWHLCQFHHEDIDLFSLDPFLITVNDTWDNRTFVRNCTTEKVVYLEPIKNITFQEQWDPLGLLIIVNDAYPLIMAPSMTFEVKYANVKSDVQIYKIFEMVDGQKGLFLDDVIRGAEYTLSLRVKGDGTYGGYWSLQTDVHVQLSYAVNILYILLYVIVSLITITGIILFTTYQRRYLKKKVWPEIPSPEHHFKELYTTHKGNFKTWLDQTDVYLTWISRNIFHEGPISTLEVLSELPTLMPPSPPPAQLPPKESYVTLDETLLPHFPAWMVSRGQIDVQIELLSTTEAPLPEKISRSEGQAEEDVRDMTTEEVPPVERKNYPTDGKPHCFTIQREDSLSLEEGKQSPGSSFEYTVVETCNGLLSPRTRSIPPRQPLKYAYLLMSESGEESPPPSPNIYQNSMCSPLAAHVYSQC